mmetsp:Transcript_15053/g.44368  ORF Transcript_15053/g.44368 Transcript_15053/m.44368 type:complete len:99 (-) Transcript_15053:2196-2492(-)
MYSGMFLRMHWAVAAKQLLHLELLRLCSSPCITRVAPLLKSAHHTCTWRCIVSESSSSATWLTSQQSPACSTLLQVLDYSGQGSIRSLSLEMLLTFPN